MKIAIIIFLILLIVFTALLFTTRYLANAENLDNWFNELFREQAAQSPALRALLNLQWDGDAKSDYLADKNYQSITIELDRFDGCTISDTSLDTIVEEIQTVTGKQDGVELVESDIIPLTSDRHNSAEIRKLSERYKSFRSGDGNAVLYLLCIGGYSEEPSQIGRTVYENGIVLFWNTMRELAGNNQAIMDAYIVSTTLHEFGHQMGINHIDTPQCLMQASMESPSLPVITAITIPKAYCHDELEEVQKVRDSLYTKEN